MPCFRAGTRIPLLFFRRGGNARDGGSRGIGIGGFFRGKISARPRGAHRRELLREGEHRRLLLDAVFFAFPPPLKFPQMRGMPTRQRTQILFGKGLRARRDSGRFRHRSLRSGVRMKLRRTARFFSSFVCVPAGTQRIRALPNKKRKRPRAGTPSFFLFDAKRVRRTHIRFSGPLTWALTLRRSAFRWMKPDASSWS